MKEEYKCCTGEVPRGQRPPYPETKCNNSRNERTTRKWDSIHPKRGGNQGVCPAVENQSYGRRNHKPNGTQDTTDRDTDHLQNKRSDYMGRREAGGSSNGQQSANQCHCPKEQDCGRKRNLPHRLQNRKLPPCPQQALFRDEEDNFVSPDIHGHPRTPNISPMPILL
jgi:hypothetical protein